MFALGIQGEGVGDCCEPWELVWVVKNINYLKSRAPVCNRKPVYI